jgi:hypothetical protein
MANNDDGFSWIDVGDGGPSGYYSGSGGLRIASEIYNNYASMSLKDIKEDFKRKKDKFDEIAKQFRGTNKKYTSEHYKAEEDFKMSRAYLNRKSGRT